MPLSKIGIEWLGAGWLAVARFAIAAPLLALLARGHLRAALTPRVVAAGAIGYGGVILLQNVGIERTSVSHAALIVGAVPVLVALIVTALGRGDRRGALTWAGSLLALAGVGTRGRRRRGRHVARPATCWCCVSVDRLGGLHRRPARPAARPRRGCRHRGPARRRRRRRRCRSPWSSRACRRRPRPPAPVVALAALALAGTALAFSLFAWAQARVPAEVAGAFVNLEPLVGAATGAVVFHDAVGPAQLLGGAAILAGIALGLPRNRASAAHEPAGRPVVRRRGRHDAGRALRHRPAARGARVRREDRADEHARKRGRAERGRLVPGGGELREAQGSAPLRASVLT